MDFLDPKQIFRRLEPSVDWVSAWNQARTRVSKASNHKLLRSSFKGISVSHTHLRSTFPSRLFLSFLWRPPHHTHPLLFKKKKFVYKSEVEECLNFFLLKYEKQKAFVFLVVILIKSRVALCARTLKLVSCCHLIFSHGAQESGAPNRPLWSQPYLAERASLKSQEFRTAWVGPRIRWG